MVAVWVVGRWPTLQSAVILLCMATLGGLRSSSVRQAHQRVEWPDDFVRYEAVVVSETAEKPKTVGMDVIITDDGRRLKCYVAKDKHSMQLKVGDRLQLCSRIERNSDWRIGTFDYRRYLEVHGFSGQTFVRHGDWQLLPNSWQGLTWWERIKLKFLCFRHTLLGRYRQMGANGDQYAVIAAMTLGDKSAMTQELKEVYAINGASHVLALSGLHLGIIYMILSLMVMGRRFRLVSQVLIVLSIWAFVLMVGMSPSVVRSAVMISIYALLSLANRNRASLNALALAALIMLLISPDSLFDVGFQFSFLALLAILTIQPLMEGLVSVKYLLDRPLLRWLWGLVTVSLAAQIGVAPMIAYYFGRFSTYFILTNLLVVPATSVILYLALASLLIPVVGVLLVQIVGWLNNCLSLMATHLPYASIEGLHPSPLQTTLVYVIIISIYMIIVIYDKRI